MTKKQKRNLFVLIGIVAVLVVALLAVRAHNQSVKDKAADAAASAEYSLTSSDLKFSAISYTNATATLSFAVNESGSWYWVDDPDFPLNNDDLTKLSNTLTGLTPQQTITDGDTLDAYGLTSPAVSLTATETDGKTLKLTLGNATSDGESYYMLKDNDQSKVYVVSDTLYTELTLGIYDMMQLPELPVLQESQLSTVTISGSVETTLSAAITKSAAKADSSQGDTSADSSSNITWRSSGTDVTDNQDVSGAVEEVCAMVLDHCEDYKPSKQAVSICGFDKPACVVSVNYTAQSGGEGSYTLTVGNKTADGKSYCVRVNDDTTIYAVTADSLSSLLSIAANGLSQ